MASLSLATLAVRGVFWTSSPFVVQLLMGVLFYTVLETASMGRFEWALIIVMLLALVADLGLGSALVQYRDADAVHFNSAFWTSLGFGATITALAFFTAPYSARVLGGEQVDEFSRILQGLCLLVPFASVSGILRARLQRELRFRAMAVSEAVSVVAYAVTAVALLQSLGIMSAVVSAVIREIALLVGLWGATRWLPGFVVRRAALAEILPFGLHLASSRFVSYVNTNLPSMVVIFALGPTALGYYRFAHRLTLAPLARISTVIQRVFFPTFSTIQEDDALLRRGYVRTAQTVALFYWPALAAMFVFAADGLELMRFLKDHLCLDNDVDMGPALIPLYLLLAASLVKAVGATVGSIFLAKGKANWTLYWSLFSMVVLLPALMWGVDGGVSGVAAVIAGTSVVFLVLSQALTNRLIALDFATYFGALVRPAAVTAAVFGALYTLRPLLPGDIVLVCVQAAAASVVCCVLMLRLFAWSLCLGVWRSLRGDADRP